MARRAQPAADRRFLRAIQQLMDQVDSMRAPINTSGIELTTFQRSLHRFEPRACSLLPLRKYQRCYSRCGLLIRMESDHLVLRMAGSLNGAEWRNGGKTVDGGRSKGAGVATRRTCK
jgi:hypothetical protein